MINSSSAIVRNERQKFAVNDELAIELLILLKAPRSVEQLHTLVSRRADPSGIDDALEKLRSRGYVVPHCEGLANAAFWIAAGGEPQTVAERLETRTLAIVGEHTGFLERRLSTLGIRVVTKHTADLTVHVTGNSVAQQWERMATATREGSARWALLHISGSETIIGPIFGAGHSCWHCYRTALLRNRLTDRVVLAAVGQLQPIPAFSIDASLDIAATQFARWLILPEESQLGSEAVRYDALRPSLETHKLKPFPHCQVCGIPPSKQSLSRVPQQPDLSWGDFTVGTSGGHRTCTTEETLSRWEELVDPLFGPVSHVACSRGGRNASLHWATADTLGLAQDLESLKRALAFRATGKGATETEARVSALGEAIERASLMFRGDEPRKTASLRELGADGIHPNDCMLLSEGQTTAQKDGRTFDADAAIEWSPLWSLRFKMWRWLPTEYVYFGYPYRQWTTADSNGVATGNSLSEALVQGFLELVERDAYAIWWANGLGAPDIPDHIFRSQHFNTSLHQHASTGRRLRLLDLTQDAGIPVVLAASWDPSQQCGHQLVFSAGAHFDREIAAVRAIGEVLQRLSAMEMGWASSPTVRRWLDTVRIDQLPQLASSERPMEVTTDRADTTCIVDRCVAAAEKMDVDLLIADLTRPEIGVPVARVVAPGLRHYWPRYAPGRLFDVPVTLGWRKARVREEDIPPPPAFIMP